MPWDDVPCPWCPCAACRRWAVREQWTLEDLAAWRAAIVESVYLCVATACRHRWLETTSPAYRHPPHCKVCGLQGRGGVITRGIGDPLPSDRFVFDRDDGLGPKF